MYISSSQIRELIRLFIFLLAFMMSDVWVKRESFFLNDTQSGFWWVTLHSGKQSFVNSSTFSTFIIMLFFFFIYLGRMCDRALPMTWSHERTLSGISSKLLLQQKHPSCCLVSFAVTPTSTAPSHGSRTQSNKRRQPESVAKQPREASLEMSKAALGL